MSARDPVSSARPAQPGPDNDWHGMHVELLLASYRRLLGRELLAESVARTRGAAAWQAPFALLSHGLEDDPLFNYANQTALALFEFDWDGMMLLPSRASAEPARQDARARIMAQVREHGFVDDYTGIRIARSGRRFAIEGATVWNVSDGGRYLGQAATFARWRETGADPDA